ncbi:hypothetical protein FRC04_010728 [Tulasnella sp. 424]|nr:hypothetical protein FRC04_010728 [Tulasnella sp. 424]KAG8962761.1 hypothetical protein FRC05_005127 [Tulasnella sp. 425]
MPPKDVPIKPPTATSAAPTPQNTFVPSTLAALGRPDVPATIAEGDGEAIDVLGVSKVLDSLALGGLAGVEELPLPVRRRVEGLKGVHVEFTKLETKYRKELYELNRKYSELYNPIYNRRAAIVAGHAEPTEEDISVGFSKTREEDPEAEPLHMGEAGADADEDIKGVPKFWVAALKNHMDIAELITERDEEALAYLKDIRLEYLPSATPGYKLSFYFAPNEFFTNDVLTKTYIYEDEVDFAGDYVYSSAEGTTINWNEEKDLTKTYEVRKQRNKNTNRTRIIKRAEPTPSFFDFFSPPAPLSIEQIESHGMTEEQLEEHENRLELDYQVGEDLKDKIIPRAIDFFTGKVLEYEEDSIMSDEEEDEENQWEEDSDDSEDVSPVNTRRQVSKQPGKTDPGECKNQ